MCFVCHPPPSPLCQSVEPKVCPREIFWKKTSCQRISMHCRNLEIVITISWFIFFQYVKQTFFSCQDFPQQISIKTKIKFYVVDDQFLDAHLYEELWLIEALWLKKDVQLEIAIFAIISIYCCSFYLSNYMYWVCIAILFFELGRYSNNQNGNWRWFSPWRGGGVSSSTYLFWKIMF